MDQQPLLLLLVTSSPRPSVQLDGQIMVFGVVTRRSRCDEPRRFGDWWCASSGQRRLVLETSLILAVVLLAFMRPRAKRAEFKLSRAEAEGLLADWTPEPLVSAIVEEDSTSHSVTTRPDVVLSRKLGSTVLTSDGAELIDFCTFDFLGLSCDEDVKAACIEVLDESAVGRAPTWFLWDWTSTSTQRKIAEFMDADDSIMYSDAASTSASVIPAFAKRSDMVFISACYDAILTGVMLSRCKAIYFTQRYG